MKKRVLEEQYYVGINMSYEEKQKYLELMKKCREISDTLYPVGDVTYGDIVEITFEKLEDEIKFNGSVNYSSENISENRSIYGYICFEKESIIVDMFITRLCVKENNEYSTVDEFKNGKIKSFYNAGANYKEKEEKKI